MKKRTVRISYFVFLTISLSCLIGMIPSAYAHGMGHGPAQKFSRGFFNLVASPFQLPKEIIQATASHSKIAYLAPLYGMTLGLGKGVYSMAWQFTSGLADLFTFSTPLGKNWGPVIPPPTLFPEE